MYIPWTEQEYDILKQYFSNLKTKDLQERFLPHRTIGSIRVKANCLNLHRQNKFFKNEDFFKYPNTINSSIAGIFASDGHLRPSKTNSQSQVLLGINTNDMELLEQIKFITTSNARIISKEYKHEINNKRMNKIYKTNKRISFLRFYSANKWTEDLYKYWNIPTGNKSLTIGKPNFNDLNLSLAYICGLISGDGSIYVNKSDKYKHLKINILGTKELLEWVREIYCKFFNKDIKAKVRKEKRDSKIYSLQISDLKAIKLFEKIKSLDCVFLSRKWNNIEVLEYIKEKRQIQFFINRLDLKIPTNNLSHSPNSPVKDIEITN